MKRIKHYFPLLFLLLLAACRDGSKNNTTTTVETIDSIGAKKLEIMDTLFDLSAYQAQFRHINELSEIPFLDEKPDQTEQAQGMSEFLSKAIYQDKVDHHIPTLSGNPFYGYVDHFKKFNLVCIYLGMGDGGDQYKLFTFSKSGKMISMLEAAWKQGEEDFWSYDKRANIEDNKVHIKVIACHNFSNDNSPCDTIENTYLIRDNGKFEFEHGDSILNPGLDSVRRALPYN